jgi:hypothetical protein
MNGYSCQAFSQIATLVERHTRYVLLAKVKSKDTETVINAIIKQAHKLPREIYKSLAWDRGKEMAASIEDPAVISKILTHLDDKAASSATGLLPECRAPPPSGLLAQSHHPGYRLQ